MLTQKSPIYTHSKEPYIRSPKKAHYTLTQKSPTHTHSKEPYIRSPTKALSTGSLKKALNAPNQKSPT